ncbi:VOC family protein [Pseudolysobacter antarcticus]|uniref:VOC family protein n=1 Tax=Pseudolysobacter antarcticus TaxID=2511995 RepID=A0A411HFP7_9GAMM|nr:VOC family protein [Pseudolysobacter antarcticus]QBB69301.1 VOC family protein [Pseudolysobacter antarcticus]
MAQRLNAIALIVRDYDEAIDYYTRVLDFTLVEDTQLSPEKRWVLIAPPGSSQPQLLLAKAANAEQTTRIGNQTGGRVFLFLHTDDFWTDYQRMRERGVRFCETPREESYATVVVFEDLYGNRWDFIQMKS